MWDPQWAAWQTRFALTRLDLRGFGRSGPPLGSFSHAGDVVAVLDEAGIDRAPRRRRVVRRPRRARPRRRASRARHRARARRPAASRHPVVGRDARVLRGGGGGARGRRSRGGDRGERRVLAADRERGGARGDPRAAAQRLPAPDGRAGRLAPHRGPAQRPADARRADARRHGRARQGRLPGDRRPPRGDAAERAARGRRRRRSPAEPRAARGRSTRSCSRSSRAVHEEHAAGSRPAATEVDQGREGSPTAFQKYVVAHGRPSGYSAKSGTTPTRFQPIPS